MSVFVSIHRLPWSAKAAKIVISLHQIQAYSQDDLVISLRYRLSEWVLPIHKMGNLCIDTSKMQIWVTYVVAFGTYPFNPERMPTAL